MVFAYTKKHDLLILFFDTSHPASQPSQPASHPTLAREHEGDMQSVFVYVLEHEGSYALIRAELLYASSGIYLI